MSGRLKITFAPDMPPASVEVVAPDFSTVDRVSLSAGDNKEVDVPSEGSFLRVHLASGESVTLKDPGNLNRTIRLSDILSSRRQRASVSTAPRDRRSSRRDVQRRAGRRGVRGRHHGGVQAAQDRRAIPADDASERCTSTPASSRLDA
jgi:hypothetical protein